MSVSDTREIIVGHLLTGEIYAVLPAHAGPWSMVHRKAGKISASVLVTPDLLNQYPDLPVQVKEWRSFIGVRIPESRRILNAGPITNWSFDSETSILEITGAGLPAYFEHRYLVQAGRIPDPMVSLDWTKLSLGSIAGRVVTQTMAHPGGNLPIVIPPDVAGTNERHYKGYDMGQVWERLTQLMEVQNGPDLMFQPRMKDESHIEWQMRIGDPLLSQDGDAWRLPIGNGRSSVLGYSVASDGADMAYRVFTVGSGTNEEALIAQAADYSMIDEYGFPLLERKETYSSVTEMNTLNSWANANVGANKAPWKTWKFKLDPTATPRLGDYRPGDWVVTQIDQRFPFLPLGEFRGRIMTVSGDLTGLVTVELTPTVDGRQ